MDNQDAADKPTVPKKDLPDKKSEKTEVENILTNQFDAFTTSLLNVMKEVSIIADKRLSIFLLTLGTTFLFLIIFLRLKPLGLQVSELSSAEFIVLVLVATLLLAVGVYLQFYQYQKEREVVRSMTETGTRIIEKSMETSARIQERTNDSNAKIRELSLEAGIRKMDNSEREPQQL